VSEKPLTSFGKRETCEECGGEIEDLWRTRANRRYCSDKCRYRHRDRVKYLADPEAERAKSRAYYWRNRERVIARVSAAAKAKRRAQR
jgi:hypothetical protein